MYLQIMPKTIFLTSSLDLSFEDDNGTKLAHKFTNLNGIQKKFKEHIKNFNNFLYVASIENDNKNNDLYFNLYEIIFL